MRLTISSEPINGALPSAGKKRVRLSVAIGAMIILAMIIPHAALTSAGAPDSARLDREFSSPGPTPHGLAWDGTHLWVVDDGADTIYKLDAASGTVLSSFSAPGSDPRGLAWDGTHLWTTDNSTLQIYKLDPDRGTVLDTLDAPVQRDTGLAPELGGLAWDGEHLWCGVIAGWSSKMIEVDPSDGSAGRSYFTKGYPRALASDGTFIWNATDNSGRRSGIIYKYMLSDGMYVSQCDTPSRYPTALAHDGQHLWYADRETQIIGRLAAE
jgi:DNA-binding beta-propeller fold protein YncE